MTTASQQKLPAWRRAWAIEGAIVLAVFLISAWWGASYWTASFAAGRPPVFRQDHFEPSVMIACGKGFVISDKQPKPLADFLEERTDTFSCDQIPAATHLGTERMFQANWRYLLSAVGYAWRWSGISWRGLGPLCGVFFGLTIAAAYGIARLVAGRWLALAAAFGFALSTQHLINLPHFRDYSKAPFVLALVLLLGWLLTAKIRRATVVALAAAYGAVLGIGYGFRTDFLADIPPLFIVLALFLDGGVRRNWSSKLAGAGAFALGFAITAFPIYTSMYSGGGGPWHVALLGFTTPFDRSLRVTPGPYDWGSRYEDGLMFRTTLAYSSRTHPEWRDITFNSHEYDVATSAYFKEIVSRFPGDMITRALASTIRVAELPFEFPDAPLPGFASRAYRIRSAIVAKLDGWGPGIVGVAMLAVAAYDLRLGFGALCLLLYFCGYPAIQFDYRHYFHFEFVVWTAIAGLLQLLVRRPAGARVMRVATFVAVAAVATVLSLGSARLYQERQVRTLLRDYASAAKTPIDLVAADAGGGVYRMTGGSENSDVRFLEVDVNAPACGEHGSVGLRYGGTVPTDDYSRTFDIPPSSSHDVTRVFSPIYPPAFQGIRVEGAAANCLAGAYWVDVDHRPLLLGATLAPEWERQRLYQKLRLEP